MTPELTAPRRADGGPVAPRESVASLAGARGAVARTALAASVRRPTDERLAVDREAAWALRTALLAVHSAHPEEAAESMGAGQERGAAGSPRREPIRSATSVALGEAERRVASAASTTAALAAPTRV
jgi:hypothetical protein